MKQNEIVYKNKTRFFKVRLQKYFLAGESTEVLKLKRRHLRRLLILK